MHSQRLELGTTEKKSSEYQCGGLESGTTRFQVQFLTGDNFV